MALGANMLEMNFVLSFCSILSKTFFSCRSDSVFLRELHCFRFLIVKRLGSLLEVEVKNCDVPLLVLYFENVALVDLLRPRKVRPVSSRRSVTSSSYSFFCLRWII